MIRKSSELKEKTLIFLQSTFKEKTIKQIMMISPIPNLSLANWGSANDERRARIETINTLFNSLEYLDKPVVKLKQYVKKLLVINPTNEDLIVLLQNESSSILTFSIDNLFLYFNG